MYWVKLLLDVIGLVFKVLGLAWAIGNVPEM